MFAMINYQYQYQVAIRSYFCQCRKYI